MQTGPAQPTTDSPLWSHPLIGLLDVMVYCDPSSKRSALLSSVPWSSRLPCTQHFHCSSHFLSTYYVSHTVPRCSYMISFDSHNKLSLSPIYTRGSNLWRVVQPVCGSDPQPSDLIAQGFSWLTPLPFALDTDPLIGLVLDKDTFSLMGWNGSWVLQHAVGLLAGFPKMPSSFMIGSLLPRHAPVAKYPIDSSSLRWAKWEADLLLASYFPSSSQTALWDQHNGVKLELGKKKVL